MATDVVGEIAARAQTDQVGVVCRGADRDRFGRPAVEIGQIVGDFLQLVGVELVGVSDLIE